MNKHNAPSTLEQEIVTMLANDNAGSEALADCIRQVEAQALVADQAAADLRRLTLDLVASPDAKAAHERVVNAELTRDRLNASLPKLREKLSTALAAEQRDRWWSDYHKVKEKLDEAVTAFKDYEHHANTIVQMFALAAEVDKAISELNGRAPNGIDRRLRSVELTARTMTAFSRDQPALAANVVLPRWDASARNLWPQRPSTSLAAEFASSMMAPSHPGVRWADPDEQARKRAAIESDQARSAAFHEQAAADEERRVNEEERQRFATQHKRG